MTWIFIHEGSMEQVLRLIMCCLNKYWCGFSETKKQYLYHHHHYFHPNHRGEMNPGSKANKRLFRSCTPRFLFAHLEGKREFRRSNTLVSENERSTDLVPNPLNLTQFADENCQRSLRVYDLWRTAVISPNSDRGFNRLDRQLSSDLVAVTFARYYEHENFFEITRHIFDVYRDILVIRRNVVDTRTGNPRKITPADMLRDACSNNFIVGFTNRPVSVVGNHCKSPRAITDNLKKQ